MKIGIENNQKSRITAAEARCSPKQTTNDEGTAHDLQIAERKRRSQIDSAGDLSAPRIDRFTCLATRSVVSSGGE
jgi:hypothetical protein